MKKSVCLLMFALSAPGAYAGALDPEAGPGSTMYTLTELYQKLELIDARTASAPAPSTNNAGAVSADVLSGKEFWGLTTAEWGPRTGTIPDQGAGPTITPTSEVQTVSAGYYSSDITVQGDADLLAENIAEGVDMFGVVGTFAGGGNNGSTPWITGQTTSYRTGDNGTYQTGWERFTKTTPVSGQSVLTDNLTGLMWHIDGDQGSVTWNTAIDNCQNLSYAGFTDWRLPTLPELISIAVTAPQSLWVFTSSERPALWNPYWSSTTRRDDDGSAWYVNIGGNKGYGVDKDSKGSYFWFWPVRTAN